MCQNSCESSHESSQDKTMSKVESQVDNYGTLGLCRFISEWAIFYIVLSLVLHFCGHICNELVLYFKIDLQDLFLSSSKPSLFVLQNDVESICKAYDAFLSEFPLCYGYWKKYANHMANYCNLNEAERVYERAVEAMPYCVDIWVSYCSFGMLAYEDPADARRLANMQKFVSMSGMTS